MSRKKVTPGILEEMKRLREEGLSYEKIAAQLKLAPMTVYNYLAKKKEKEKKGLLERLGLKKSK